MFSNFFLKSFRILLLPFALLYWLGLWVRNKFYDWKIFKSASFGMPIICVGNLSVGGTGKSPVTEYLVRVLKSRYKVATLSRGYKRKTRGYALAGENTTALEIGDEPMLFHIKHPDIPVAVGEERLVAIPQLLHDRPDTQVIILDDAFQHRAVRAGLNILLTDHANLYTRDFYLPTGDLRDLKYSARRAQAIIVTKNPQNLSTEERDAIIDELGPARGQEIFFTTIDYGLPYHIIRTSEHQVITEDMQVLLVTGIANPRALQNHVDETSEGYHMLHYPDHHIFTIDDLREMKRKFESIESPDKLILTTEKDAMRLLKFQKQLHDIPFFVIPIEHRFLFNDSQRFTDLLVKFVSNFAPVN